MASVDWQIGTNMSEDPFGEEEDNKFLRNVLAYLHGVSSPPYEMELGNPEETTRQT
jgi:hypothetical protein